MSVSVIMPTCGRPTIRAAVISVLSQLEDGDQPRVLSFCALSRDLGCTEIVYDEVADPASRFGNAQRDRALELATGTHLAFLDDDDVYEPGALALMRAAIQSRPHGVHVFRATWGAGHHAAGITLWAEPVWAEQNVAPPMIVMPRMRRLPKWMEFNERGRGFTSDFGWLSAALGAKQIHWHDQVVCTVRPEPVEAAA